jgi:hypothetical protein
MLVYRYEFEKEGEGAVTYDPEFQLIRPMDFYVRARKRTNWPGRTEGYDGVTQIQAATQPYKGIAKDLRSLPNSTIGLEVGEQRRYVRISAVKAWASEHGLGPLI